MICGTFTMNGVPNGQQDAIVNGFQTNVPAPTSVTKTRAADGTWTITAVWPPCPTGTSTTHSPDSSSTTTSSC
jgi:hypothetical protein